jgi:hypothetical protein
LSSFSATSSAAAAFYVVGHGCQRIKMRI